MHTPALSIPAMSTAATLFSIQAFAIITMALICGLTVIFILQNRQMIKQTRQLGEIRRAQNADNFMRNQLSLVRMTLDAEDDGVMSAWGDWPEGLTTREKRIIVVQNAEMTNLQIGFENDLFSEEMIRESIEETFNNIAGHVYWQHAGPKRMASAENENEKTRRFHEICAEVLNNHLTDNPT